MYICTVAGFIAVFVAVFVFSRLTHIMFLCASPRVERCWVISTPPILSAATVADLLSGFVIQMMISPSLHRNRWVQGTFHKERDHHSTSDIVKDTTTRSSSSSGVHGQIRARAGGGDCEEVEWNI